MSRSGPDFSNPTRRAAAAWSLPASGVAALLLAALAAPLAGQGRCDACGQRPYVCEVEIRAARGGERPREIDPRRGLRLSAGETIDLEIQGIDQSGRRFPAERAAFGLDLDRRCPRGFVRVEERGDGRFRISPGGGRGECDLWLWVPGNLNLEWRLPLTVGATALDGYSRAQAETIARALYQALLGRDADPPGLAAAVAEIQRGRLSSQIEGMARSPEFSSRRSGLSAGQLLDSFYLGLLGREADSSGVRTYLRDVERGKIAEVVMDIVRSEEFESRLASGRR